MLEFEEEEEDEKNWMDESWWMGLGGMLFEVVMMILDSMV